VEVVDLVVLIDCGGVTEALIEGGGGAVEAEGVIKGTDPELELVTGPELVAFVPIAKDAAPKDKEGGKSPADVSSAVIRGDQPAKVERW